MRYHRLKYKWNIEWVICILQNYWMSRRSIQEIEMSSQQGNFQHDQVSSKAGVVITSFRQSHRRFVRVFLTCLTVYVYPYVVVRIIKKSAHVDRSEVFISRKLYDIVVFIQKIRSNNIYSHLPYPFEENISMQLREHV